MTHSMKQVQIKTVTTITISIPIHRCQILYAKMHKIWFLAMLGQLTLSLSAF